MEQRMPTDEPSRLKSTLVAHVAEQYHPHELVELHADQLYSPNQ